MRCAVQDGDPAVLVDPAVAHCLVMGAQRTVLPALPVLPRCIPRAATHALPHASLATVSQLPRCLTPCYRLLGDVQDVLAHSACMAQTQEESKAGRTPTEKRTAPSKRHHFKGAARKIGGGAGCSAELSLPLCLRQKVAPPSLADAARRSTKAAAARLQAVQ